MIDPDSTQAVSAPGRHRVRHWEDAEGYRTRPPYAPPASSEPRFPAATATTGPQPQSPATTPVTSPQSGPASEGAPPPGGGQGRLVYREEAMRRHVAARSAARMPLVISGPSFLLLWIAVAVVLAAGAALVALALGAGEVLAPGASGVLAPGAGG
ncbi:hypothetical protein [Streptosporangium sp. V21-05]|uniref:hypothetical protein n=1 Tax=Streptosporangium sp. V21-05 TaxID=3446115 RepID=UPI003F532EF8